MFTVTAHCVSPPLRQVRLPASIPIILNDTTAASRRLAPPAAPRPPPRPLRARPPCPRPPPASALLTQPAPAAGPLVDNIHDAGTRHATPPAPPLSGIEACSSAVAHCSPRAGQDHPAALRPLAPLGHPRCTVAPRAARAARPPARLCLPTVTASRRSRAACPRWVRLTTPRRGCSLP